jgi:hypothetical protein
LLCPIIATILPTEGKSKRINGLRITEDGNRVLLNLAQHYDAWMDASRRVSAGRLQWKTRAGHDYLYRISGRPSVETSLGRRGEDTERQFADYTLARRTRDETEDRLKVDAALYRALRLPQLPSFAGDVLRELDLRSLLGTSFLVIGTNALVAYAIEAVETLPPGLDTTDDFDLTWVAPVLGGDAPELPNALFAALKGVDATYTINTERQFQLRNARGHEVELLLPAALAGQWGREQKVRPLPLPEQDWLLNGKQISHVVCDLGGKPARVAAPDPRWFGLHKLWLSAKPTRSRLKVAKDERQGRTVLDLVQDHMPHFPLDDDFRAALPDELVPWLDQWEAGRRSSGA